MTPAPDPVKSLEDVLKEALDSEPPQQTLGPTAVSDALRTSVARGSAGLPKGIEAATWANFDSGEPQDHSPVVDEILTEVPGWLIRSGTGLIFLATLSFLVLAWFLRYPEVVIAPVVISTATPMLPVIAQANGELALLAKDRQLVERGQALGYVRGAARYEDIQRVAEFLSLVGQQLDARGTNIVDPAPAASGLELGELESAYSRVIQSYADLGVFLRDDIRESNIQALEDQHRHVESQAESVKRQVQLKTEELEIAREKHQRLRQVYEEGAISASDFRESEMALLGAEQSLTSLNSTVYNQRILSSQLSQQLMELRHQQREASRSLRAALAAASEELSARIATWREQNLLRAPGGGVVSLFTFRHDGEFIRQGDEVLTILPEGEAGGLQGRVSLARRGSGRVAEGQRVRIKLDRYPFEDFGTVGAVVNSITPVARDDRYIAYVELPQGLKTSYGFEVELRQDMVGLAEIYTDNQRLLERLFNQLRVLIDSTRGEPSML